MKFKLVPITKIKKVHHKGPVYDLTVWEDHSYNINGKIVHNSACSTRIASGIGYPGASSLCQIRKYSGERRISRNIPRIKLIQDGGLRTPGDIFKSMCLGADAVFCGSVFAGTDESPGKIIEINNNKYKLYRGSASESAQLDNDKVNPYVEGASGLIPYKGPRSKVIQYIENGIRSGMSYIGATDIKALFRIIDENDNIIIVSGNTITENRPHAFQ